MALTVREQILVVLAEELRGITKTGGYSQDVARVTRGQPNEVIAKSTPQPAIWIWSGPEAKELIDDGGMAAAGQQWNELELNVIFLVRTPRGAMETVGTEFNADIEKVLISGPTRLIASTPVDVRAKGNLVMVGSADEDQAGGHAQYTVGYSTVLGDPRTGA